MNPYRKRALRGYDHDKKKSNRQERQYGRREAYKALRGADNSPPYRSPRYTIPRNFTKRPIRYNTLCDVDWWKGL